MKKRNLNRLGLNKKSISKLNESNVAGGGCPTGSELCIVECDDETQVTCFGPSVAQHCHSFFCTDFFICTN